VFTPYAEAGGLLASSAPEIQASCNLVCCIEPVLENSSDQFGGDGTLAKPAREAEILATANGIEVLGFHRFFLGENTTEGLLMGFAGFTEREIRRGVRALAKALESTHSCGARARPVVTTKCS
jgi:hypothetical protein